MPVRIEGPSQLSLFDYGNGTFVVESYRDHPAAVRIIGGCGRLTNLTSGAAADAEPVPPIPAFLAPAAGAAPERRFGYELRVEPHSFVAFRESH